MNERPATYADGTPTPRYSDPKLTLRVGGTYNTRDCALGPVRITREHALGQFTGILPDGHPRTWFSSGKYNLDGTQSNLDLVSEVTTPANEIDRQYGHNSARAAAERDDDIPHAELIRAVLDGKVVQWRKANVRSDPRWSGYPFEESTTRELRLNAIDLMVNNPQDYQFRLKPEPIVRCCAVWPNGDVSESYASKLSLNQAMGDNDAAEYPKVLRIEFDPDTLAVISARTEDA